MLEATTIPSSVQRKFELDWLRLATVMLVFLHHVGMPFNGDHWHIMNNESSKLLDDIMVYFEQWRLPLLLLISGAGTVMAFSKRTTFQFIKERSRRLLIPLIFGAMVIVPPQTYFEFIDRYDSYLNLYPGAFIHLKINHLWFIKFLFVFSLITIPLIRFVRSEKSARIRKRIEGIFSGKWGLLIFVIPLMVLRVVTKKYFPEDDGSLANLSKSLYYFYFFLAGIILFACKGLWHGMLLHRKSHAIAALVSLGLFYGYYYFPQELIPPYISLTYRWNAWWAVCSLVGWTTMLTVLGYAQVYLNKPHRWLAQLNEAVYPFYILHQTVIVVLAYFVVKWPAPIAIKLVILAICSFIGIVLIYRLLIYPFGMMRVLFGMKSKLGNSEPNTDKGEV